MSSKKPEIDVYALIDLVKTRPCIWCKSHESYSDKVERRAAWKEVFQGLNEGYDSLTPEDRKCFDDLVQSKWTNLRDTFIKTLKPKRQKAKKYVYYDHLCFLLRNTEVWDSNAEQCEEQDERYFEFPNDEDMPQITDVKTVKAKKQKKRQRHESTGDSEIQYVTDCPTEFIQESHFSADSKLFPDSDDPRVMNEDEAFFASLLPTVATYTTEERLEFRMEVLSVMKRLNDNRSTIPGYE